MSLFDGLKKSRKSFFGRLKDVVTSSSNVDDSTVDELEDILLTCDIGFDISTELIDKIRKLVSSGKIKKVDKLVEALRTELKDLFSTPAEGEDILLSTVSGMKVILVVGVNGSGKTTSIGKLAQYAKDNNKKVMLAACDTFRAAAIEQLEEWARRADVPLIKQAANSDPAAVAYDAMNAAISRNFDLLLVDTAGRLHNKTNLMIELKKIKASILKLLPDTDISTMLVLDGTTGQNALNQAKEFYKTVEINSLTITKLDGTAKGGAVFSICKELDIPIEFICTGEKIEDIERFNRDKFIESFFSSEDLGK